MSGIIQSRAVRQDPPAAKVLEGYMRATNKQRRKLIDHLDAMDAAGCLSPELHDTRVAEAEKAETTYDLQRLMADLPPYPVKAPTVRQVFRRPLKGLSFVYENIDNVGVRWLLHGLIAVLAIAWMTIPSGFVYAASSLGHTRVPLIVFFIASGTVALVLDIIAGCTYADNDRSHKPLRSRARVHQEW